MSYSTSYLLTLLGLACCHPRTFESWAPFYGHWSHPHAVRESRRRQTDPAREHQRALHGSWPTSKLIIWLKDEIMIYCCCLPLSFPFPYPPHIKLRSFNSLISACISNDLSLTPLLINVGQRGRGCKWSFGAHCRRPTVLSSPWISRHIARSFPFCWKSTWASEGIYDRVRGPNSRNPRCRTEQYWHWCC